MVHILFIAFMFIVDLKYLDSYGGVVLISNTDYERTFLQLITWLPTRGSGPAAFLKRSPT
jgi:hypothetical protein